MMAVVEFLQHRVQLAAQPLVLSHAEDLRDHVGRQSEHAQLARALEDLVDREVPAKHEVPTVMCPPRICGARVGTRGWRGGARSAGHISKSPLTATPTMPGGPDRLARLAWGRARPFRWLAAHRVEVPPLLRAR